MLNCLPVMLMAIGLYYLNTRAAFLILIVAIISTLSLHFIFKANSRMIRKIIPLFLLIVVFLFDRGQ